MQSIKGPQGIQCLVSALIAENFTIADAVNMLNVSNELDTFAELTWEDIPYRLRSWLETQDGLKINGCSISSIPDILKCHRLLCRKSSSMKDLEDCSIIDIILQVAIRYFKQINTVHIASRITSFIVKGSRPVPRKCGSCKSQILDDAFPRFKKLEPSRYVVRFLKGGCGLDNCTPKGDNVWAVPLNNDMIWTTPDANGLRQPPQRAKWADILIRTGTDILDLPKPVSCICRRCRNADCTFIDSQPRWTIETKPRYVPRKPRCSNCGKSARWRPIETSVDWIDSALLSKLWAKFTERNWCVDELLRKPDRFFPRRKKV